MSVVKRSIAVPSVLAGVALCLAPPFGAGPAQASEQGCINESWYDVVEIGTPRYQYRKGSACTVTKTNLGYLCGITTVPFWSECVATTACTPKP